MTIFLQELTSILPSKAAQWAGVYPHSSLALSTFNPFLSTNSSTTSISLQQQWMMPFPSSLYIFFFSNYLDLFNYFFQLFDIIWLSLSKMVMYDLTRLWAVQRFVWSRWWDSDQSRPHRHRRCHRDGSSLASFCPSRDSGGWISDCSVDARPCRDRDLVPIRIAPHQALPQGSQDTPIKYTHKIKILP